jgi:hypothetical protein
MLCFVIALKSKVISKDWKRVSTLFENTLGSIFGQTNPDFKVIVVCHETPCISIDVDHRLEVINVDFPPPAQLDTKLTMQDKWHKLSIGMIRAGELKPNFIMFVDADDLVSNQLVDFVDKNKEENGWILRHGYNYTYGSKWIYISDNFSCGSDSIVNSKLIQFPKDLSQESVENCIVLRWGHTIIATKLAELGTSLKPLPFLGAMQTVNHGDNDSSLSAPLGKRWFGMRHFLGKIRRTRPLTQRIRTEFSMRLR